MPAVRGLGHEIRRGHCYDPALKHGFIGSQKQGIEVFRSLPLDAPLIVCEAVWQYSQQILPGLVTHRGPILTVANWSGEWPGLVGMLNLNAYLTKAGVLFSALWSADFKDPLFTGGLRRWLAGETIVHDRDHVQPLASLRLRSDAERTGGELACDLRRHKAILSVFDEGCMGMYNGIIEDALLFPLGIGKERLSQSALYAAMLATSDAEAQEVRDWLDSKGMRFLTGPDPCVDLRKSYGLRTYRVLELALYHSLGKLPEPESTHEFF